jgi:hypothetical protein
MTCPKCGYLALELKCKTCYDLIESDKLALSQYHANKKGQRVLF